MSQALRVHSNFNIDFESLRKQKQTLLDEINALDDTASSFSGDKSRRDDLEGLLQIIDKIQDDAAEFWGEEKVFGSDLSEDESEPSEPVKKKFRVGWYKSYYRTGEVIVEAVSWEEAERIVLDHMGNFEGSLQSGDDDEITSCIEVDSSTPVSNLN
jgi:hypothetical protein